MPPMSRPLRWSGRAAMLLLPLLFAFVTNWLARERGPLWLGANSDPSYQYLFNSLLVVNGLPPCHVDHPGTTVQMLGALVLTARQPGMDFKEITHDALAEPERALAGMEITFTLLAVCALAIVGCVIVESTGSVMAGAAVQLAALAQVGTYRALIFVAPEALLVALTLLLVTLVLARERAGSDQKGRRQARWFGVCLGLVAGAGVVTKVTFAPLCLLPLLLARSWREGAWIGGVMAASAAGFLAPIVSQIPRMLAWFTGIATHTGTYGGGARGLIEPARYLGDLARVLTSNPVLLGVLLVSGLVLVVLWRRRDGVGAGIARLVHVLRVAVVVQILGLLLVAKHPHQNHYVLPVALSCLLNVALLCEIAQAFSSQWRRAIAAGAVVAGLIVVTGGLELKAYARDLRQSREAELELKSRVDALSSTSPRIDYYRCSSPEFALYLGNGFAWRWFSESLAQLHPGALFFNVANGRVENFGGRLPTEKVLGERPLLVFGSDTLDRLAPGVLFPTPSGWKLTLLDRGGASFLHRVERAPPVNLP